MAAGDTPVSICSDALILLGAKPISSFNDGTDEANTADRLYPNLRDSALMMQPWSFAYKKVQLSQLLTTPINEWQYKYQMPGDSLGNPRAVFNTSAAYARPVKEWEIQGTELMTNELEVYIDYPYRTPEYAMPSYFIQFLKYMVAWHLAYPISEQQDKASYWQAVAIGGPSENNRGGYFRTAANIDSQGQPSQVIEDFSLIAARY
jgi:hypothetical protein